MTLKTYSADQVIAVLGVINLNSGAGPDEFLSIEYDEDDYSLQVGVTGEAARSKTNNGSATITLTVMQTSSVNALLSAARALDKATPGGLLPGPFGCTEQGAGLPGVAVPQAYVAAHCWIQKSPTRGFGRDAGTRVWTLRTEDLITQDGTYAPIV